MISPESVESLEDLVGLVQSRLKAACVFVTRISEDRQHVLAHAGRPLPKGLNGSATLEYSICQHSVAMNFPLVIDDALSHPLMRGNRAVSEMNIAAYLGAPVHVQPGRAVGALCAIEYHQRRWTEEEIQFVNEAANIADGLMVKLM